MPKWLALERVAAVLASCDRDTVSGRRNYTILLLLARLGLRAGEIVAMTLDDVDWDNGVVTVSAKRHRPEPMPIPEDVGEALAEYLRDGRPRCITRRLFLCLSATCRRFAASTAICDLVARPWRAPASILRSRVRSCFATRWRPGRCETDRCGEPDAGTPRAVVAHLSGYPPLFDKEQQVPMRTLCGEPWVEGVIDLGDRTTQGSSGHRHYCTH